MTQTSPPAEFDPATEHATATTAGAAGTAATVSSASTSPDLSTSYFTDALLRPERVSANATRDDGAASAEVSRILLNDAVKGAVPEGDKSYIASIVAARTGLSEADARSRVDTVLKQIDDAKVAAQAAADKARKAAATTALVGSISLLIGAFISSAAAALGGRQRDEEEDILLTTRGPLV